MAKNLFSNEDVLKWMQYFADNSPIDLEQITMMDVTKGNANIITMVEAHKAVLAFMEAGDKEVFYRMWNAGLGDCEVWYNEGSSPSGPIKHDSLKDMIDRGIRFQPFFSGHTEQDSQRKAHYIAKQYGSQRHIKRISDAFP